MVPSQETKQIYLDSSSPIEERVVDLISRLTLQEKIDQMISACKAIPRLGIPAYDYWSEGLHGVARNGRATVFPQAITMAASWDVDLIKRVADAISSEGRAKYHETLRRRGDTLINQGLTFWAPNVNIFRDPRWGRGQETWGEDPYLTGEMGSAYVRGLQGDDPKYMKAAACAKHYAVHSGPESLRHVFDARPSRRDLYDTYLPAFKKLVMEARVEAVMGAYNRLYGEPCNGSTFLLRDVLRKQWGFEGHVVSDCWALTDFHKYHKVTKDIVETAAKALKAGCEISCMCTYDHLGEAIERGLISEVDIDLALKHTLATRFKLGMFDPPEMVPYSSIKMDVVNSPAHRQVAYEAALKSVVLLMNRKNVLPVEVDKVRSIFVTGPNAGNVDVLLGNYNGMSDTLTTMLEGITGAVPEGIKIEYRIGCQLAMPSKPGMNWSVGLASESDLTIACMGISPLLEGEEGEAIISDNTGDRNDIRLPAVQVEFLRQMAAGGAKTILVVTGGSPIALGEVEDYVQAILFVGYPGQEGGKAVADLIFGKASPSGKLPITFPKSVDQLPPFEDYSMKGRTYRYAEWEPLYPFGFGLSYPRFAYKDLALAKSQVKAGTALKMSVKVENTGKQNSEEVVQVYLKDLEATTVVPIHKLVAFKRVALKAGQSKMVEFILEPESMMLVDDEGKSVLEPGAFKVTVGGCSPGKRGLALGAPAPQEAEFRVV
jgi:beta-glucosidase